MPDALTMLPLRCPEGCGRIEVLDQEDGSWRKRLDCMLEHGEVEDVEEVCRLILHPPCAAHFFLLVRKTCGGAELERMLQIDDTQTH